MQIDNIEITKSNGNNPEYEVMFDTLIGEVFGFSFDTWLERGLWGENYISYSRFDEDTVWLTQAQMAELFGVKQPAISKHLKNIFNCGELDEKSIYSILEFTTKSYMKNTPSEYRKERQQLRVAL